jgi:hypothetical protein
MPVIASNRIAGTPARYTLLPEKKKATRKVFQVAVIPDGGREI